jgi:glutathionyl-hydroquinone reductase
VYKSGFATTQKAYENNVLPLFESLDRLEKMLEGGKEFVAGDKLTEADVRLFTTLVSLDRHTTINRVGTKAKLSCETRFVSIGELSRNLYRMVLRY